MRKEKYLTLILSISIILTLCPNEAFSITQSGPINANTSELDFSIDYRTFEFDYFNNIIIATARISSPTNSTPEIVEAEINGINTTMIAPIFQINGQLNNKYFSKGIIYYAHVENPNYGEYSLTIHAGNSSGIISSKTYFSEFNKNQAMDQIWSNGTSFTEQIGQYKFLFGFNWPSIESWRIDSYEIINRIILTINGTNYIMMHENFPNMGDYNYIHGFGPSFNKRTYEYNFTIETNIGNFYVPGGELFLDIPKDESHLDVFGVLIELDWEIRTRFVVDYNDGMNREPLIKICKNGLNQTVSYITRSQYEGKIQLDAIETFFTSRETLVLDTISFKSKEFYNVSVWWYNGTWHEEIVYENQYFPEIADITEPKVNFLNTEAIKEGEKMVISTFINITSNVENFMILEPYIPIEIWAPEIIEPIQTKAFPVDSTNNNFTNGKIYEIYFEIWSDGRDYWGNIIINASIFYGNDSVTPFTHFNQINSVEEIFRNPGIKGIYEIKNNDILTYNVRNIRNNVENNINYVYNFTKVAYEHGTDIIVVELFKVFDSNLHSEPVWYLEKEITFTLNMNLTAKKLYEWINLNFSPFPIYPRGLYQKLIKYINEFPIENDKVDLNNNIISGITTISYSQKIGDFEYKFKDVIDRRGILRSSINKRIHKGEIISVSSWELDISLSEKIMNDYTWYFVIGGGIAIIGTTILLMIKRKKQRQKSKINKNN